MTMTPAPLRLPRLFLVIAMAAQVAWCAFNVRLDICAHPDVAYGWLCTDRGDFYSYVGAMENLISNGEYSFINFKGEKILAGRMPHYSIPYFIIRQVAPAGVAADILILLQTMLIGLAVWMLGGVLWEITGSKRAGILLVLLASAGPHLANYACLLQPDAAGVAALTIACCLLRETVRKASRWNLLLFSFFATYLVLLRPHFVVMLPLAPLVWLYHRSGFAVAARRSAVMAATLVLALAPWWIRNARHFDRFFPFQQDMYAGYGLQDSEIHMRSLMTLMGENATIWWEPSSVACLMARHPFTPCTATWPAYWSPAFRARIEALRVRYLAHQDGTVPAIEVIPEIDAAAEAYRSEYPFRATVGNKARLVALFFLYSGSNFLAVHADNPCYQSWQMVPKLLASATYLTSVLGFIGALVLAALGRFRRHWAWLLPGLFLVAVFPIALGAVEWRYFATVHIIHLFLFMLLATRGWQAIASRTKAAAD